MTAARRSVVYSENIGAISSSEPAAGAAPGLFWSCQLMDDVELDLCRAWVGHSQFFGRRDRDIDDAARHKRTAIRTTTEWPLETFVTRNFVPNGRLGCAAVIAFGLKVSPFAVSVPSS